MVKYFVLMLLIASACSNSHKADYEVQAELRMTDTLQARLKVVNGWLDKMKLEELQERIDIIHHNTEFVQIMMKEKALDFDEETARQMQEYISYGQMYERSATYYKPIVTGLEESLVQLRTLKESAYGKDYQKDVFLKYFAQEKEEALKIYALADSTLKPAIESDLAFERTQNAIETLAESLKE